MKVALSIDWVIERDHAIEMLDLLAELYREAELYTLVHIPKAVIGPIEERPIRSTFLSKKVTKVDQIFEYVFSLPSLARGLFIPCSTDTIVNVSRGLSHGFKKCDKTQLITYVYDLFWLNRSPQGLKQKLFWGQAKSFALKEFKKANTLWVANTDIQAELLKHGIESEVLEPFFKVEEFPLFPASLFKREAIMIEPGVLTDVELERILLRHDGQTVRVFGEAREGFDPKIFLGAPCAGELAPMLASSKVLYDFSRATFPKNALAMLSCGGQVLAASENKQQVYLECEGTRFLSKDDLIEKDLDQLMENWIIDPKKCHAHANRFHGTRFKRKVQTRVPC